MTKRGVARVGLDLAACQRSCKDCNDGFATETPPSRATPWLQLQCAVDACQTRTWPKTNAKQKPKRLCLTTKAAATPPRLLTQSKCVPKNMHESERKRRTLRLVCNERHAPQRRPHCRCKLTSKAQRDAKRQQRGNGGKKFHPFECIFENAN